MASRRRAVMSDRYALIAEPLFHLLADRVELALRAGLESHDEDRLRVRGANEAPSVAVQHAHAVDIDYFVNRSEVLSSLLDDSELDVVGTVDTNLRCRYETWNIGHHLAHCLSGVGNDPQHPRGSVHRIVEAIPSLGEEHVPRHLTSDRRMRLVHLFLNERVPRLPHERLATGFLDLLGKRLRALHIEDYRLTFPCSREHVTSVDDEDVIAPDDLPFLVDDTDAVRITVEGNAELGSIFTNGRDHVLEILRNRRVRVMIRERPVTLAKQDAGL